MRFEIWALLLVFVSTTIAQNSPPAFQPDNYAGDVESSPSTASPTVTRPRHIPHHGLYESIWAAWTQWSHCHEGVHMRGRACNTMRGFKCLGSNLETKPCGQVDQPQQQQQQQQQQQYGGQQQGTPSQQSAPAYSSDTAYVGNPDDPWEEDRRIAWEQLYGAKHGDHDEFVDESRGGKDSINFNEEGGSVHDNFIPKELPYERPQQPISQPPQPTAAPWTEPPHYGFTDRQTAGTYAASPTTTEPRRIYHAPATTTRGYRVPVTTQGYHAPVTRPTYAPATAPPTRATRPHRVIGGDPSFPRLVVPSTYDTSSKLSTSWSNAGAPQPVNPWPQRHPQYSVQGNTMKAAHSNTFVQVKAAPRGYIPGLPIGAPTPTEVKNKATGSAGTWLFGGHSVVQSGSWSTWSSWSSCGQSGEQSRTRSCTYDMAGCRGHSYEVKKCGQNTRPVGQRSYGGPAAPVTVPAPVTQRPYTTRPTVQYTRAQYTVPPAQYAAPAVTYKPIVNPQLTQKTYSFIMPGSWFSYFN